ncbi:MAG TPA: ester cyclase [Flavitalea sp.]|nr:ester cyclase [Flavitalea sp.]
MKVQKTGTSTEMDEKKSLTEKNKSLVTRAVKEIWNEGNYNNLEEFISADFVAYSSSPGEEDVHGYEGAKYYFTQLRNAFPDLHFTITDQIAEGDKVVTHWTASGTHKGEFKGIPPTGKKFAVTSIDIERIVDGKVTECWANMDELGLLQQLGVIPASGQSRP